MTDSALRGFLLHLWRFSIVYSVVVITLLYCKLMAVPFEQVDAGINRHKFVIILLYFAYLAGWWWLNPRLRRWIRPY